MPTLRFADVLTLYRLGAAPVAAGMALAGCRDIFFVLIILSLFSDLVDGPIARWSKQTSEFGARIDTFADAGTVLAGGLGLWLFEAQVLRPEWPWLGVFVVSYAGAAMACLVRFGEFPAYHLYLSKAAAIGSGVFVVWLYLLGFSRIVLLAALALGVLANLESILVTLRLPRFRTDVGSLLRVQGETPRPRE